MPTERKPADYSKSAVKLVNPLEVREALNERESFASHISHLKATLEAYPEWAELRGAEQRLADHDQYIQGLIDQHGSYQDLEQGYYGVKYRRVSKSYQAEPFIENYPKYSPAVIVNSVNVKALEGLIKGGLLTEDDLRNTRVLQESISFAYLIKAE